MEQGISREKGLALLNEFIENSTSRYARERNYSEDSPASKLSAYFRYRLILEHEALSLLDGTDKSHIKYMEQILWRLYFKYYLENNPWIWSRYIEELSSQKKLLNSNEVLLMKYQEAMSASTGITCFDYWVHQLNTTGYLHNHERMWFASIWIFTLKLPWVLGAEFFYNTLIDADPASNTLSWRWVAGLHTKGKHYAARAENIKKYTRGRFYPQGELDEVPLAIVEEEIPIPREEARALSSQVSFPKHATLIICDDDVLPEVGILQALKPKKIVLLTSKHSLQNQKEIVRREALDDTVSRVNCFYKVPVEMHDSYVQCFKEDSSSEYVGYYPFVGENRDALENALSRFSVSNHVIRREEDRSKLSFATKGYFKFRQSVSEIAGNS